LARIHFQVAKLLLKMNRYAEADAAFEQARTVQEGLGAQAAFDVNLGSAYFEWGEGLRKEGRPKEAMGYYQLAARWPRQLNPMQLNNIAWFLVTCPNARLRDPAKGLDLAKRIFNKEGKIPDPVPPSGLEKAQVRKVIHEMQGRNPSWIAQRGDYFNTLGVAYYRAGNWRAAVGALEWASLFHQGGNSSDFFFLAMAHWRLGEKHNACTYFDRGVRWMDKIGHKDKKLRHFRAEAAALLKIEDTPGGKKDVRNR
jgi:tetratricopeptide (TPR) repeat protein